MVTGRNSSLDSVHAKYAPILACVGVFAFAMKACLQPLVSNPSQPGMQSIPCSTESREPRASRLEPRARGQRGLRTRLQRGEDGRRDGDLQARVAQRLVPLKQAEEPHLPGAGGDGRLGSGLARGKGRRLPGRRAPFGCCASGLMLSRLK